MPYEFKFPDVGEGISEGELVKWHVKEGDTVKEDDVLAEVETDKAVAELPSPKAGKILKLHHKEGDTIKVGETIVTIGESGEEAESVDEPEKKEEKTKKKEPKKEKRTDSVVGELDTKESEMPASDEGQERRAEEDETEALPAVRRLARDLNVDISSVPGTGKGGRVTEEDVRKAAGAEEKEEEPAEEKKPAVKKQKKYDMYGYVEHKPLRGVRKATARHMTEAMAAVHVTAMDDADVTELWTLREREKEKAAAEDVRLTFLPFVVKAVVAALKKEPFLNSTLDEEHEEIILKKYYSIGVAVDIDGGLVVPVIKNADQKSVFDIAREIQELAQKARDRKLDLADMKGGTFTITNFGSIGTRYATPIINYPEAGILGVGRIRDEPVARKGKVAIRKIMPLSLAFDHRILDGADAAKALVEIKKNLEDPAAMLLES